MEVKMNNKKVIGLTIFIILGMIICPTVYKIYQNHNNNLILVVESKFYYNAKNCYNADDCLNSTVYLKDLYEKDYIKDQLTNPLNKKYYSEESYINLETKEIKLIS